MTRPQGDLPDYLATVGATVSQVWTGRLSTGSSQGLDVTAYNSVLVAISQDPGVGPVACWYEWVDPLGGGIVDGGVLSANISTAIPFGVGPSWVLPVRAGKFQIGNEIGSDVDVYVLGQPAYSQWRMNHDGDPSRSLQTVIGAAQPANTVFAFTSSLAAGLTAPIYPGVSSYNGEVTLSLNTAAGTSGTVEALWRDSKNNLVSTPLLVDAGGGLRSQLVTHPRAYCTWQYRLSAASPAAAHNAFLSVTPS